MSFLAFVSRLVRSQMSQGSSEVKWLSSLPWSQEFYIAFEFDPGISSWVWSRKPGPANVCPQDWRTGCWSTREPRSGGRHCRWGGCRISAQPLSSVTLDSTGAIWAPRWCMCTPSERTKRHPNNPFSCEWRLQVFCFKSDGIVFPPFLSSLCFHVPT